MSQAAGKIILAELARTSRAMYVRLIPTFGKIVMPSCAAGHDNPDSSPDSQIPSPISQTLSPAHAAAATVPAQSEGAGSDHPAQTPW